jgi:hypothetical protein
MHHTMQPPAGVRSRPGYRIRCSSHAYTICLAGGINALHDTAAGGGSYMHGNKYTHRRHIRYSRRRRVSPAVVYTLTLWPSTTNQLYIIGWLCLAVQGREGATDLRMDPDLCVEIHFYVVHVYVYVFIFIVWAVQRSADPWCRKGATDLCIPPV